MRMLSRNVRRALVLAAAALGLAACNTNKLVYPGSTMELPDAACGHPDNAITITAGDGTQLRGWFFNRGANTPLVVMFGGNAMNVGSFTTLAAADPSRSYLLMNYRGYGNSSGTPSEKAIISDARYSIRYARNLMGNTSAPLYLVGFSLGSGVATQLATTEAPAGLILVCPFDSMTSVACNVVPFFPRLLPMDSWKSVQYAPQVTCPVTIMRANFDDVVPANSTEKLIRAFRTQPVIRNYPANHNNIFATAGFANDLQQAMPITDSCQFDF